MRRIWTAIVAAAIFLGGGCGDDEEPAAPTITATSAATTETPATTAPEAQPEPDANGAPAQETASEPKRFELPDVIDAVLTGSADPALICDELATEDYVRTAYGAREGCIAAQKPGALAQSLQDLDVEIADDRATATAVPRGGPYDGVEVEVALVRDGKGWRVDALLADVPAGP